MRLLPFPKLKSFLPLLLPAAVLLGSCDRSILYEENSHIPGNIWNANDSVFFTFTVQDTLKAYDFGFNVRNTTSYSFQNLYLFLTAWYPDGTWSRDTAECMLAAPDGKWYGKGMGKIKDSRFVFRRNVHFRRAGTYRLAVNQAMRTEKLEGISDIGVRIVQSGNQK